ncbi:hypothetical protein [Oceanobacillus jeddahense]|uniref:Uncharacterized protein n=1 Tax=Oceanobacillus jeddahense TaxID=1462527 RepID=A0ABY5JTK5_9BACI|nr:hypothetical protein [Oceanobacillus jeddahense]UUI02802.1 hypothetical protein NP439_22655 [Oceanobacillus jeddahense]
MFTRKQLILHSILIAVAVILNATVGFSRFMDTAVLGFFVILASWFWYDNHRKKKRKKCE